MPYGTLKVDNIIFTNSGVDQTITVSGIVASTSGNLTVTGTVRAQTISGATITGNAGQFTTITGGTAGFTTITGGTVTGITANFITVSGTTVTGNTGNFTTVTGGTATFTSGVFASGTAALPSVSFISDPNTGLYSPGADQVAISTSGTGRLLVDASGNVTVLSGILTLNAVGGEGGQLSIRNTTNTASICTLDSFSDTTARLFTTNNTNLQIGQLTGTGGTITLHTEASERMRIAANGNVGINTVDPAGLLHCAIGTSYSPGGTWSNSTAVFGAGGNTGSAFAIAHDTTNGTRLLSLQPAVAWRPLELISEGLVFKSKASLEAARIDSSGRLLVGTSTARTISSVASSLQLETTGAIAGSQISTVLNRTTDASGPRLILARTRGVGNGLFTSVILDDQLGNIRWHGADGISLDAYAAEISAFVDGTPGANDMPGRLVFSTTPDGSATPSPRMTIKNDGNVGIGTSSPAAFLNVAGGSNSVPAAGATGASALFGNSLSANTYGLALGATSAGIGYIQAQRADGVATTYNLSLQPNGGNVGIGTTSPGVRLDVAGGTIRSTCGTYALVASNGSGTGQASIGITREGGATDEKTWEIIHNSGKNLEIRSINDAYSAAQTAINISRGTGIAVNSVELYTANSERARIDSSGRLLVGISQARNVAANLQWNQVIEGTYYTGLSIVNNQNNDAHSYLVLGKSRGTVVGSSTAVVNGDGIGAILFAGADGTDLETQAATISCEVDGTPGANDMPGRLVFNTTADGASTPSERMRITSGGYLKASNTGTYTSNTSTYHELRGNAGSSSLVLQIANTSSTGNGVQIDINSDGTAYAYLIGYSTSAAANRIIIWSNGNVVNTNNSYGAISDIKLKENIVDANSQWSDIKSLQVRNYNLKEGQTHTQIGLVAQEVELVSPGLVTESTDRDAEGNDLGTTTKSVNYSVLYMKAVKALQEAMERIETLEAKVAALEAA